MPPRFLRPWSAVLVVVDDDDIGEDDDEGATNLRGDPGRRWPMDARCDDGDSDDVGARPATTTRRTRATTTAQRGGDVDGIVKVVVQRKRRDNDSR
jgi:hypothetical protein